MYYLYNQQLNFQGKEINLFCRCALAQLEVHFLYLLNPKIFLPFYPKRVGWSSSFRFLPTYASSLNRYSNLFHFYPQSLVIFTIFYSYILITYPLSFFCYVLGWFCFCIFPKCTYFILFLFYYLGYIISVF